MPTHRPKKPYVPPKTDGTFIVRDSMKDGGTVWGRHLFHAEAVKLKEQVTGSRKSRSARIEPEHYLGPVDPQFEVTEVKAETPRTSAPTQPMFGGAGYVGGGSSGGTIVIKPGETTLEQAREAALRAAAPVAAAAQARANIPPRTAPLPLPPPAPEVDIPDGDNEYLDDDDIASLLGEVGGNPTSEDVKRAHAQAEADWKASDVKMKDLESKRMPIPNELVTYVGRVPEGYAKGDGGIWSPSGPAPHAA